MADAAGPDWRGFRLDRPSAVDPFDPAQLEERLVEARARRAKALAARSEGLAPRMNQPSLMSLGRAQWNRPVQWMLFLGGIAVGAFGAVAAIQMLLGAAEPPPHIAVIAAAPSQPARPIRLATAPIQPSDFEAGNDAQPTLVAITAEADPELPAVSGMGAARSIVRLAGAVPSISALQLARAEPGLSIVRAALDTGGSDGGDLGASADDPTLMRDRYPDGEPVAQSGDRTSRGRPDRPSEPSRPRPLEPSEPPTGKPPTANPKPPPVVPPDPPSSNPKPQSSGQGQHNSGKTARDPGSGGPPGQRNRGAGNGPPDHAQAGGRSAGHGSGSGSGSRGNSGSGGPGNSGKDSNAGGNGKGNGNGRKQ